METLQVVTMSNIYVPSSEMRTILPLYESIPEGDGPFPTVILWMHAPGMDDFSKKVLDDLAMAGYYAVGMDSYLNGKYNFQNRSDDLMFATYDVTTLWLKQQPLADMERLGAIGFCMGGRHAYLTNAYYDHLKAVVSFYGFPHRGDEGSTPQNMIERFTAPHLSIFGSEDKGIPMEAVNAYKEESSKQDLDHRTIVYEGAGHGFLNFNSRNHSPEASEEAWSETIEFFDLYLK